MEWPAVLPIAGHRVFVCVPGQPALASKRVAFTTRLSTAAQLRIAAPIFPRKSVQPALPMDQ